MPTYEFVIHNKHVRECLSKGNHHKTFSDNWGESHYIEFIAPSEASALSKCQLKYPDNEGFVIEGVSQV